MADLQTMSQFLVHLEDLATDFGIEVKREKHGVTLWPTYDEKGGLGEWFAVYIK